MVYTAGDKGDIRDLKVVRAYAALIRKSKNVGQRLSHTRGSAR